MAWKNIRVNQVVSSDGEKLEGFNIVVPKSVYEALKSGKEVIWETGAGVSIKLKGRMKKV